MTTPSEIESPPRTRRLLRVGLLESAALKGGEFHLKLNIPDRPIAHKYRKGKVKRTLKRESKVLETAYIQWIGTILSSRRIKLVLVGSPILFVELWLLRVCGVECWASAI